MFSKLKNALSGSSSSDSNGRSPTSSTPRTDTAAKFPYMRPHFLNLNDDEVQNSADHRLRPLITPHAELPLCSGYAECINAGKSRWNEDQAVLHQGVLMSGSYVMPYKFFALFDGHAGVGAAICAANQLHHIVHERLVDAQDDIWTCHKETRNLEDRDLLICGALEAAFHDMDDQEDIQKCDGGCTALVAVIMLGMLYVANAGDSRAVLCKTNDFENMSTDFTPETEKTRLRQLAQNKPELLGRGFTYIEYLRQPKLQDLGKRVLYRDAFMKGWAYKTVEHNDLKTPVVSGQGKRSRLMSTIGVTRGFGDHKLLSTPLKVPIKPLLTCHPEVKKFNLSKCEEEFVLVMGTDGLWDVVDGHTAVKFINYSVEKFSKKERYASAAACIVGAARGTLKENTWMMKSGKHASVDDISAFVIPLYPCVEVSPITQELEKLLSELPTSPPSTGDISYIPEPSISELERLHPASENTSEETPGLVIPSEIVSVSNDEPLHPIDEQEIIPSVSVVTDLPETLENIEGTSTVSDCVSSLKFEGKEFPSEDTPVPPEEDLVTSFLEEVQSILSASGDTNLQTAAEPVVDSSQTPTASVVEPLCLSPESTKSSVPSTSKWVSDESSSASDQIPEELMEVPGVYECYLKRRHRRHSHGSIDAAASSSASGTVDRSGSDLSSDDSLSQSDKIRKQFETDTGRQVRVCTPQRAEQLVRLHESATRRHSYPSLPPSPGRSQASTSHPYEFPNIIESWRSGKTRESACLIRRHQQPWSVEPQLVLPMEQKEVYSRYKREHDRRVQKTSKGKGKRKPGLLGAQKSKPSSPQTDDKNEQKPKDPKVNTSESDDF